MNYKNKSLILITSFIITLQIFIFLNNNQKTSFRYFIWNIQDIKIGKLISISFLSGVIVSTILNNSLTHKNNENFPIEDENVEEIDELETGKEYNSSFDIPPQRDVRETQPTISVNYRVIKNLNENEDRDIQSTLNKDDNDEDWGGNNKNNDW